MVMVWAPELSELRSVSAWRHSASLDTLIAVADAGGLSGPASNTKAASVASNTSAATRFQGVALAIMMLLREGAFARGYLE